MSIIYYQLENGSGVLQLEQLTDNVQSNYLVEASDLITNTTANTEGKSRYEIDDRTGFKELPQWHPESTLVRDGYGKWTRAKSADPVHPQDKIRSKGNAPTQGPQFAEPDNTFLDTFAYIFTESGLYLLQENGSRLLTEQTGYITLDDL